LPRRAVDGRAFVPAPDAFPLGSLVHVAESPAFQVGLEIVKWPSCASYSDDAREQERKHDHRPRAAATMKHIIPGKKKTVKKQAQSCILYVVCCILQFAFFILDFTHLLV
jgi:hypothetical protein